MVKKILIAFLSAIMIVSVSLFAVACSCDHKMKDATCTEPKTCTLCGEKKGEPLGHDWNDNNVCTRCGESNNVYSNIVLSLLSGEYHLEADSSSFVNITMGDKKSKISLNSLEADLGFGVNKDEALSAQLKYTVEGKEASTLQVVLRDGIVYQKSFNPIAINKDGITQQTGAQYSSNAMDEELASMINKQLIENIGKGIKTVNNLVDKVVQTLIASTMSTEETSSGYTFTLDKAKTISTLTEKKISDIVNVTGKDNFNNIVNSVEELLNKTLDEFLKGLKDNGLDVVALLIKLGNIIPDMEEVIEWLENAEMRSKKLVTILNGIINQDAEKPVSDADFITQVKTILTGIGEQTIPDVLTMLIPQRNPEIPQENPEGYEEDGSEEPQLPSITDQVLGIVNMLLSKVDNFVINTDKNGKIVDINLTIASEEASLLGQLGITDYKIGLSIKKGKLASTEYDKVVDEIKGKTDSFKFKEADQANFMKGFSLIKYENVWYSTWQDGETGSDGVWKPYGNSSVNDVKVNYDNGNLKSVEITFKRTGYVKVDLEQVPYDTVLYKLDMTKFVTMNQSIADANNEAEIMLVPSVEMVYFKEGKELKTVKENEGNYRLNFRQNLSSKAINWNVD